MASWPPASAAANPANRRITDSLTDRQSLGLTFGYRCGGVSNCRLIATAHLRIDGRVTSAPRTFRTLSCGQPRRLFPNPRYSTDTRRLFTVGCCGQPPRHISEAWPRVLSGRIRSVGGSIRGGPGCAVAEIGVRRWRDRRLRPPIRSSMFRVPNVRRRFPGRAARGEAQLRGRRARCSPAVRISVYNATTMTEHEAKDTRDHIVDCAVASPAAMLLAALGSTDCWRRWSATHPWIGVL